MSGRNYQKIINHYEDCLRKFGDNHKGVDWPNQEDALLRYKVMLDIVMPGIRCSLLDFGCGTAHLYDYIVKCGFKDIEYTGLDISNNFIQVCMSKHKQINFINCDILKSPEKIGKFDYIIMNGIFTVKRELLFNEMVEYFEDLVKVVFTKANIGIAFNVMTKHVDWEREDLFHLPFDLLAAFLKQEVSRNFVIRNDYGLFEYTVYVFKEPNIWHR